MGEVVADGATVLLASHEPDASWPLADRVVSLSGGRVAGTRAVGHDAPVDVAPEQLRAVPGGAHVA